MGDRINGFHGDRVMVMEQFVSMAAISRESSSSFRDASRFFSSAINEQRTPYSLMFSATSKARPENAAVLTE